MIVKKTLNKVQLQNKYYENNKNILTKVFEYIIEKIIEKMKKIVGLMFD